MDCSLTGDQLLIRDAGREVCAGFPGQYWRDLEAAGGHPAEFVATMTRLAWLWVLVAAEPGGGGQAGGAVETRRIPLMFNYHTYQVFFSGLRVPAGNLIGVAGRGFRHVLDGFNAERCLLASEAIGDGLFFLDRASEYASRREVFGRPIGANQGVALPLAQAKARVEAASLPPFKWPTVFGRGKP